MSIFLCQISSPGGFDENVEGGRLNSSSLTAFEETLRWQRTKQLVQCTRELGHKYLLLGDNASQLAVHCLAGIAQGRGQSVGSESVGHF